MICSCICMFVWIRVSYKGFIFVKILLFKLMPFLITQGVIFLPIPQIFYSFQISFDPSTWFQSQGKGPDTQPRAAFQANLPLVKKNQGDGNRSFASLNFVISLSSFSSGPFSRTLTKFSKMVNSSRFFFNKLFS